jgi:hypothetical protein
VRRLPTLAVVALTASLPAGCGRDRYEASDLEFRANPMQQRISYPKAGMRFRVPGNVLFIATAPPGVFRGSAGDAVLAGFAYRRAEQLPRNKRELAAARRRLVAATRKRGQGYKLRSVRTLRVGGARAVELLGDQRISNARLRTRSLHAYKARAEYVIELSAVARDFPYIDRTVYRPLLRSLRLTGKVRKRR